MRKGQSLIEVLVGIAIGAIFVIGAALVIAPSLQIGKQTTQVQVKTELATEMLSNVKAWAAGNWNSVLGLATGTTNPYFLNTSSSPFTILTGSGTIITVTSTATITLQQATTTPLMGFPVATTTVILKFGSNPALNDLIVASVSWGTGAGTATCTDSAGNAYTALAATYETSYNQSLQICYAVVTKSVSSDTVKAVMPSGGSQFLAIHEYSGAATSSPLDVSAGHNDNVGCTGTDCVTSSASTTTSNGDLIFGTIVDTNGNGGTITAGTAFTQRASTQYFMTEDMLQASAGSVASLFSFQNAPNPFDDNMAAFKPTLFTSTSTSGGASVSSTQSVGQIIVGGNVTYNRYFYMSDVYRDSNGNVTTTASGNNYDPSTKLVTIVVQSSSTPATPTFTFSQYLTRNSSNNITQKSWSGGAGQTNPVTIVGTNYAASANVTISGAGAIQLAGGGGSCIQ